MPHSITSFIIIHFLDWYMGTSGSALLTGTTRSQAFTEKKKKPPVTTSALKPAFSLLEAFYAFHVNITESRFFRFLAS